MKINGRELIFMPEFDVALEDMSEYLGQFGEQPLRTFLKELQKLLTDRIPNHPESFPEYKRKLTQKKQYRRALFKKKYYIIYRIDANAITYIYLYHSSRNPDNIFIE